MRTLRWQRLRPSLLSWLVAMVLSVLAVPAWAGMVQLRDGANVIPEADRTALREEGAQYPFDVRVVTSSEHTQTADFDRYVAAQVARPNMVVVGVDPLHRHTAVHFGRETGIAPSQFRAIEEAGNSSFREGNWRRGVEAILASAKGAVGTGVVTAERGVAREEVRSAFGFGLVTILVVLAGIGLVGAFIARRVRGGGYQQPPYPPGYGGGYPPGYGPGYGGGGGIGSTLLGAGLGGLAGYELGKMVGEREHERDHDIVDTGDMAGGSGNFDEGGAAGGWDDSGGGGGDFGGGDFGGGDGGGGSDW
jgi:hypothetical protein